MKTARRFACIALAASLAGAATLLAQTPAANEPYKPEVGQEGKDVVWVPTPPVLVEKMLDLAQVTSQDFVMDLGSGDGRNIIAAARRGARGLGVEYNPDMVELSRRTAEKEGVAERAEFVQGDMYEADISRATVLALFLLPENLNRLAPKFLELRPGSRIVMNAFVVDGWDPDETETAEGDCGSWCTALLYIVPAKVEGAWRLGKGELRLKQQFQKVTGTYTVGASRQEIRDGRLRGDLLTFTAGATRYEGRVNGNLIQGNGGKWRATRIEAPASAAAY